MAASANAFRCVPDAAERKETLSPVLLFALLLPWLLVAFLGWLAYQLVRQHGRMLLQLDELGQRLAASERALQGLAGQLAAHGAGAHAVAPASEGLSLGSPAPAFALPDLDNHRRSLQEFQGRPLLLVFFNTGCGFCLAMAPRLGQLPDAGPRVVVIGSGDRAEYRRLAAEHGWRCDMLLDTTGAVQAAYRVTGTPMGYLLDEHGRIASQLAAGADDVLRLFAASPRSANGRAGRSSEHAAGLTAQTPRQKEQAAAERARAAGLAVRESRVNRQGLAAGTKAPDFNLPDLAGDVRSLVAFRGRRVLLVFSDPKCGPCQALAPRLVQLQERQRDQLQVVMVSRGELGDNRAKAGEHGLNFPVLLQNGWQTSMQYAMFATPAAYLIDEHGVIADDVAVGGDAILRLAERVPA